MSLSTLLLLMIAIVLVLLGVLIFLYLVIKRSRKISFAPDASVKAEPDKKEPAPSEFLQYGSDLELRSSFRRALRTLKTHITGRDFRYRVPWYLLAGESQSGKTSLLDSNGLKVSINDALESDRGRLNWYFFDDGVVMDVSGDFVLRNNKTANHRGWNTILRLLQKHRPQRPLDGLVLTIPCTDLFGKDVQEVRFDLEQKANSLYKKLWQAQKILGMRLPVYVLVTKCDEVAGFATFCKQLPEEFHTQMFGWSNPSAIETAYEPELVMQAFESLHNHLSALQFEIYAERDEIENVDDLFLFPTAMQSLREPLEIYLDCLFKQSAYHDSYLFRGLYFCGEASFETVPEVLALAQIEQELAETAPLETTEIVPVERKPVFLSDFFKKKVFTESSLAQPIKRVALSRNRTALTAQVLSLLIVVIGGVGLAFSYRGMVRQEAELYSFLKEEEADLKKVEAAYERKKRSNTEGSELQEQMLHNGETKLLSGMADMNANKFHSAFIPSSWFSSINERIEHSIGAAFEYVIFESLRVDLERQGKTLLYLQSGSSTDLIKRVDFNKEDPASNTEEASVVEPAPDFELHVFVEELGEYRANLERYDRLIRKDVNGLTDLRQLVKYLNHAPLPDHFTKDNFLYKQALIMAHGRPIDAPRFYKESANKVGDLIEDIYAKSFDRQNVQYDHLNDLAETDSLLSRPEYTWLATYVFDPHSPFNGMTISTALRELRKALQDLRRQEFMSSDLEDEFDELAQADDQTRFQHFVRRVLVWDQDPLRQAIALHDQYEEFVETKQYERAEYLNVSVKQAARTRLKTRMSKLFRQARRYQTVAPTTQGSALRTSLLTEIKNLQEAQPVLSRALQISTELGIDTELRGALSTQVAYLLRGIHREFVSQQFYQMKHQDFSWWRGSQPVSIVAYDLASLEDLNTYLKLQRKSIAFLARDLAVPLLTFSATENIYSQTGGFDWNEILTDLDAFDNKLPGNPIATLEAFIATEMDRVNIDSCSASLRLPSEGSQDYFLRIRNTMRVQFYRRCTELARIKAVNDTLAALANYQEIEESFNRSLSGGFPFTNLGTRPEHPDLDPSEILKFFRLFDAKEKAAREALARSHDFGAASKDATEFLDQVARVREFFAPFLEKKQGPALDFRIQFRVNAEQEIGGNQIIDWKLDVGKKKFAYLSDDVEGRWVFGDPIRLTLRWANNSPVVPVSGATPVAVKAKDRIAVFEYDDHWSLFTFLLKHGYMLRRAGTMAECDQGFDASPYTLKFSVRTDPDPAGQPLQHPELKSSNAEVFMRVSLATANKQEPLMLPCFPKNAPPVPSLPLLVEKQE